MKVRCLRRVTANRLLFFCITLAIFCASCTNETSNSAITTGPPQQNTNQPAANQSLPAPPAPEAASVPLTLPVLDAVLSDEESVNALKNEAQLSDDQVQKLRDAARNAVLQLGEDTVEDDTRSTSLSVKEAETQIRTILGNDKAPVFLASVHKRLASGAEHFQVSNEPSAVPTDTRIVVNAPAYRMDLFKDGKLVKTYKIGIGYPEFPLPSGLRRASSIIFNPTWTPPDEPWVKGKFAPGRKVEAGSKDNPLGLIKIPIGLPSLIHGGKSANRLGTFASHGCVGLTNQQVQDFAAVLANLSGTPLKPEDVKTYEKERTETKNVKLNTDVPVELRYETIVVEDGKLKIFRDVYERGTNTEENLRRVLSAFGVSLDSMQPADREKILAGLSQMARDAQGNPVGQNSNSNTNSSSANSNSGSGKVTRDPKGKKEVVFEIAELRGKGFPAPVKFSQK